MIQIDRPAAATTQMLLATRLKVVRFGVLFVDMFNGA